MIERANLCHIEKLWHNIAGGNRRGMRSEQTRVGLERRRKQQRTKLLKARCCTTQSMFKKVYNLTAANSHRNANKLCVTFSQGLMNAADDKSYQSPCNEEQWCAHTQVKAQSNSYGLKAPAPRSISLSQSFKQQPCSCVLQLEKEAAAAALPQLPGCSLETAALAQAWEFTFSKCCRDQKLVYDRETVEGDFDLAPFIKILPEKELLLCYCSRPENHRAKWWHSLYVETMLFTR